MSLLSIEEADSFSVQKEVVSLFHGEEADSFSIYGKESVSLPDAEETDSSMYCIESA